MKLNVQAIKKVMVEKRLNITALANLTGISRQSLSTILRRGSCSIINAGLISSALGVEIEEIWKEE